MVNVAFLYVGKKVSIKDWSIHYARWPNGRYASVNGSARLE